MPMYKVIAGRVGRREGPEDALRVYRVGDVVALSSQAARALADQVEPVDLTAAVAVAAEPFLEGEDDEAEQPGAGTEADAAEPQPEKRRARRG